MTEKQEFYLLVQQAAQERRIEGLVRTEVQVTLARDWRFDIAIPSLRVAWEYEGIFAGGRKGSGKSRHLTISGYSNDCEKYSRASIAGWIVIRVTPKMVTDGRAGILIRAGLDAALKRAGSDF